MTYGPGDPETWPAPSGHPHDPRTEELECPVCGEIVYDSCDECGWEPTEPDYEPDDDRYVR